MNLDFGTQELREIGLAVMPLTVKQIIEDAQTDPEAAFTHVILDHLERKKPALKLDINAEHTFVSEVYKKSRKRFPKNCIYGEERLPDPNLDLSHESGIVCLVDAVDGTDLVERGLFNWCSAAVFFEPRRGAGKMIRAAFVTLPSGETYFATDLEEKAYVKRRGADSVPVAGPSKKRSLSDASICFYGQKLENFLLTAESLLSLRRKRQKRRPGGAPQQDAQDQKVQQITTRIYNLAGMPMIMKLIDHRVSMAAGIDAVFDCHGQQPHDVVPGAFIAKKAGATVVDERGADMSYAVLDVALLTPAKSKVKYVIAGTQELAAEIVDIMF